MPASDSSAAVPPVDSTCTSSSTRPRTNSMSPRLSLTLTSARRTLAISLLHVHPRHALAHRGQDLVRNRLAPRGQLVARDGDSGLRAEEDRAVVRLHVRHVRHVEHDVVHAYAPRD